MNQVILVGKLVNEPIIDDDTCTISLAVPRYFKNEDGTYETDYIPICIQKRNMFNFAKEFLKKDSIVGIRGRAQMDGNYLKIIAEKMTFMSNGNKED